MAESERRKIVSSTPHLSPEDVVHRSFTTGFRGYSESEVRAFLKRVSEELVAARDREAELLGAVDSLEEQLRSPRPLNEPEMLDALGAETTRLLRSAREAADEIRARGEEHATQVLDEARSEAERIGTEAAERARSRTEEAEARAAALVEEAETRAAETRSAMDTHSAEERLRAEREAEEIVESARQQGREMLDEAKSTRERVLADLFRRRSLLQAQIDELRAGRDNLLDAYRVVKRTFLEATEALAHVEARAAAERVPREGDGGAAEDDTGVPSEFAEELASEDDGGVAEAAEEATAGAAEPSSGVPGDGDATDPNLADVDSLFARIRAGHAEAVVEPETPPAVGEAADSASTAAEGRAEAEETPAESPDSADSAAPGETADEIPGDTESGGAESWRARRAEVLDPLLVSLGRRAKRAAQDDQNALLDAVRRHKGRPTADQVLVPETQLLAIWTEVMHDALDEAYGAGRAIAGGEPARIDGALEQEIVATIVLPVRGRIASAIDAGEEGDTSGLVERIGARFREWKNQALENSLVDVLALAWSRGVYDASPDGAVLRWIPAVEGRCADCDDNGLEPTVKGSSFPTGQPHPPAHPGCRCLLAPSDLLDTLAASA